MATFRRRSGPRGDRWQVQVRLANEPPVSRTFSSHENAKAWAREVEGSARKRQAAGARFTVADAISRYAETVEPTKAEGTRRGDRARLAWWFDRIGDIALVSITPDRLARLRDELVASGKQPGTVNRYLAALSAVLTKAWREWGWINEQPMRRVKWREEPQGRIRFLAREEVVALLSACETKRPGLRAIAALAVYTGMRQGEVLGLRWRDVDLQRRLITLHVTKSGDRRGLPISDALLVELRRLPRRLDTDLLFPADKKPQRSTWDSWRRGWDKAVAEVGLRDFRYHDLRHTAASHLAMAGVTERAIAEILGHRTLQMTHRYSHLSKEHIAGVLNQLGSGLAPTPDRKSRGGDDE